jgi:hypothetical protein
MQYDGGSQGPTTMGYHFVPPPVHHLSTCPCEGMYEFSTGQEYADGAYRVPESHPAGRHSPTGSLHMGGQWRILCHG